ncbi:MAG: FAD-dependent oxidoreductase [Spirochaetota bacterium]|jgi:ferredoxin-NADP reductase|nr:FAD-dependent oxidoreductase [Spirochaetota bacterium]
MPLVKKYPSRVTKTGNPLEGLYDVTLESLGRSYSYLPGQFLHLALDTYDPSSPWPESRCFSMRSAAASGSIRLTFAVKGNFTRRMAAELLPGKEVVVKLPYGELFSRAHDRARTVFIAGGTGVVPFLSLFSDPSFDVYENPCLWLGVREERYHIYGAELQDARKRNMSFHVHTVCQDREGVLDIAKIFSNHGQAATYFISGPPIMIKGFRDYLLAHGLTAEQVCTDDWE